MTTTTSSARRGLLRATLCVTTLCLLIIGSEPGISLAAAQGPSGPVERLSKDQLRLGKIRVNLATSEVRVPGQINPVTVVEFFANKAGGVKAYESVLTLETDGVTFNTALLLIGMDNSSPIPSDPAAVTPALISTRRLDISIETAGTPPQKFPADRLLFDRKTNKEVPPSTWVYSGSTMVDGRYLADVNGTLIGFMHGRDPVIERFDTVGVGRYGEIIVNPALGLTPGTGVVVVIKASPQAAVKR
jgi:hypothetical protein